MKALGGGQQDIRSHKPQGEVDRRDGPVHPLKKGSFGIGVVMGPGHFMWNMAAQMRLWGAGKVQ